MRLSKVLAEKSKGDRLYTISPNATVKDAAKDLCTHKIGCLLVAEPGSDPLKYVGIISERDVIKAVSQDNVDITQMKVYEIMTRNLIVANEADDVEYVMNVMSRHKIRHLPIVGGKKIVGMLSIGDIVDCIREQKDIEIHWLSDYTGNCPINEVF